ncbi:helix-turn-helix domain-containing protein [Kribbella hippodromi]|uniref:Helix-turn-helix domain-containing protein n=1 Tax=Kribbella hippodromi TaxID=434347 RepID=A0ABP4NIC7_9ACTN
MAAGAGAGRNAERYGSSTVDKAVDILTAIAQSPAGLTNQEVSAQLGFDKSTVHRLLLTLERRGLLARTGVPARFVVGDHAQFLAWGPTPDLRVALAPVLDELVELTGESASYSIRQGDRFTCVAHRMSLHDLSYSPLTGNSYPLTSGASGLAILAFLAPPVRDEIVARGTLPAYDGSDALADPKDLRAELGRTAERGYATSGGRGGGGCSIAYPVFGRHGMVVGALAISAAEARTPLTELAAQAPKLAEAAHCLPSDLGWVTADESKSESL